MRNHSRRSTHALVVSYVSLIIGVGILLLLFSNRSFAGNVPDLKYRIEECKPSFRNTVTFKAYYKDDLSSFYEIKTLIKNYRDTINVNKFLKNK